MKNTIYKCDNVACKNETENIANDGWIEIGSDNNTLFITNHHKNRRLIHLNNSSDIHFCSPSCLVKNLFHNIKIEECPTQKP